ncbi:MAG TPA: DUF6788 family protein [Streptosporangiaceae bacterium]|nr:DUF6788 family protein [Streptosporangiaceae bacterium]
MTPHKSGLLKLSTRELLARRRRLAARLGDVEQVLLGSLVEQMRRCGKATCRCAKGDQHGPYAYFAPRRGRGMRYVPATLVASVRTSLRRGEDVEAVLVEISAINVELLARRAIR